MKASVLREEIECLADDLFFMSPTEALPEQAACADLPEPSPRPACISLPTGCEHLTAREWRNKRKAEQGRENRKKRRQQVAENGLGGLPGTTERNYAGTARPIYAASYIVDSKVASSGYIGLDRSEERKISTYDDVVGSDPEFRVVEWDGRYDSPAIHTNVPYPHHPIAH